MLFALLGEDEFMGGEVGKAVATQTPKDCLRYAAICDRQAFEVTDPVQKAMFAHLAREWREKAERLQTNVLH